MSTFFHSATGFAVGDPEVPPFPPGYVPDREKRLEALRNFILSSSGWRKVFARHEESFSEEIGAGDAELAAAMGGAFAAFLVQKTGKKRPIAVLGLDCRPTGPRIADILLRALLAGGVEVRYCFILPAPELTAFVNLASNTDGFVYVTASHNPIGHNGVKFGLLGGIIGGEASAELIENFKKLAGDDERMLEVVEGILEIPPAEIGRRFTETRKWKAASQKAYENFTRRVVTDREDERSQDLVLSRLREGITGRGFGIVAELNGSARTLGVDKSFLEGLGVKVSLVNGEPRQIVHRIVPEGDSLEQCRETLEKLHGADPRYALGYVPDNDGDRGNLVYFDEKTGKARPVEAQEVFALACVAELSCLVSEGVKGKIIIVVNDPTSLRIDRIARVFGADVVRAEVGEANVIALAKKHRESGAVVRILGEGSNGGNITYPAEIRDPLNTVCAVLKLLFLGASGGQPSPRDLWFKGIGRQDLTGKEVTLGTIIDTLPSFTTMSAYEPEALLTIRTQDHAVLKIRYEAVFLREWEKRRKELAERFGFTSWKEINYERTEARTGMGKAFRTGTERGGLAILLTDAQGTARAFLWMRGSATEPVFRILIDVEGRNDELKRYLLEWQKSMILEADEGRLP